MAYRKSIQSKTESTAKVRLTAVKKFDSESKSQLNYGSEDNTLSSENYEILVNECSDERNKYNTSLETVDRHSNNLKSSISKLKKMNSEILSGIRSKFGADSTQYEEAGGVRSSERKKPVRKIRQTAK
jgi:hypothetical protein